MGQLVDRDAGLETFGNLNDRPFAHAVNQQISPGIKENRTADLFLPVIIVGKAAQAGLDATDDQGDFAEILADLAAINDGGPVRPQSGLAAGGIDVLTTTLLVDGEMVDHRIEVASGDQKAQSGGAQLVKIVVFLPVGLGNDTH